jgi:EPS-associated MarR family transcriptional regulator
MGSPCAVAVENSWSTSARAKLQEDMYYRVLRLLNEHPEMSQRQLAASVGISVGRAHYVLIALIDKGHVKLGKFKSAKDKRRYAYVLTPKGIARKAALTRFFLIRKMEEYEAVKAEIETLRKEIGRMET